MEYDDVVAAANAEFANRKIAINEDGTISREQALAIEAWVLATTGIAYWVNRSHNLLVDNRIVLVPPLKDITALREVVARHDGRIISLKDGTIMVNVLSFDAQEAILADLAARPDVIPAGWCVHVPHEERGLPRPIGRISPETEAFIAHIRGGDRESD
jgi:hypothetical protein